ncbi:MAG: ABC transporter ATP-binding protein [Planctomycetaceae bacterium]|nr:ABC transporter ATP-binding protein [Planctomycetaceae bacterium]
MSETAANMDQQSLPPSNGRGEPTIEIQNLHRFFGKLKAVNDVSFRAYPGQVMGFIGPNGAGKTTTMRVLATLDMPTAGDAFICGHSVIDDPDKVRRLLGFMPDSFGRYPNMDVVEYLDFFARAYGFRGADRRDAVERVLVFTELRKLADKPITALSKGMSQRLCLGRTLIHDPEVLILDEPAAGLDPRARVEVRELIALLASEMKKTVLISSHILTELGEICDSAAIIEAGEILAHGTIEEIQAQRKRRRAVAPREGVEAVDGPHDDDEPETTVLGVRVLSDVERLERWLLEQPFVSAVNMGPQQISFTFSGDAAAQCDLLRRIVENKFELLEFTGKTQSLEDAFMAITEGITQ